MKYVEQREEFLPQIVSGMYYHNAILQNLSEQDTCFDSKDLIDRERNAVDLYDQPDSKGQKSFSSFNQLPAIQQLQRYAIVFRNVLASYQHAVVKEATYIPLICDENSLWTKKLPAIFGGVVGRSSRLPYAQQGLGSNLQHQMVATKSIQSGHLRLALKGHWCANGYFIPFRERHPACFDRSHESYQSAVEINRKARIFWLSR